MNAQPLRAGEGWRLEPLASSRTLEIAGFAPVPQAQAHAWPLAPGAVLYDGAGMPALLHVAAARWFAPQSNLDLAARLQGAEAFACVIEVTGKWAGWHLGGPAAPRLLARTIAIDAVLAERGCAAVTLFDCPAFVARRDGDFLVWVRSSFERHFLEVVG